MTTLAERLRAIAADYHERHGAAEETEAIRRDRARRAALIRAFDARFGFQIDDYQITPRIYGDMDFEVRMSGLPGVWFRSYRSGTIKLVTRMICRHEQESDNLQTITDLALWHDKLTKAVACNACAVAMAG